jgi:hypothetical protein
MFIVVMPNRNHREHLGMFCIVMPSIFVNCPAVICLPNIASYLRETPLVICGPRSYLLHTVYNTCCNTLLLFLASTTVFHTVLLILCSARPEGLTTSLFRVGQSSGLCCADSTLLGEAPPTSTTTFRRSPSPTISITLGRNSRENLLLSTS